MSWFSSAFEHQNGSTPVLQSTTSIYEFPSQADSTLYRVPSEGLSSPAFHFNPHQRFQSPAPSSPPVELAVPPPAAKLVGTERDRPLPTIERALSGPGSRGDTSWRRQVKVVTGGQGPGKPDQERLDRDRARLPLTGSRRIAVLGCTRGAGQTVTALMTGHILAAARGGPVR